MQFVAVQEITITPIKFKGSNRLAWNYDLDGKPFGQVYTFKAAGEIHPFHVATSTGQYLGNYPNREGADRALRSAM